MRARTTVGGMERQRTRAERGAQPATTHAGRGQPTTPLAKLPMTRRNTAASRRAGRCGRRAVDAIAHSTPGQTASRHFSSAPRSGFIRRRTGRVHVDARGVPTSGIRRSDVISRRDVRQDGALQLLVPRPRRTPRASGGGVETRGRRPRRRALRGLTTMAITANSQIRYWTIHTARKMHQADKVSAPSPPGQRRSSGWPEPPTAAIGLGDGHVSAPTGPAMSEVRFPTRPSPPPAPGRRTAGEHGERGRRRQPRSTVQTHSIRRAISTEQASRVGGSSP